MRTDEGGRWTDCSKREPLVPSGRGLGDQQLRKEGWYGQNALPMKCPGDQAEKVTLVVTGEELELHGQILPFCSPAEAREAAKWWRSEVEEP